jgi:hypothetical protein
VRRLSDRAGLSSSGTLGQIREANEKAAAFIRRFAGKSPQGPASSTPPCVSLARVRQEATARHYQPIRNQSHDRDVPMPDSFQGVMPFLISRVILLVTLPPIPV